ncbi:dual-specificity kinase [Malassezia obtusa]|uniref:Dual-specificity kinase n=1 Tax=Malassezia obtusa TaxID=76774 RepID=A0AAF0E158_9BASI|nr:dual-specificity kinase [Malassezia obtusa]
MATVVPRTKKRRLSLGPGDGSPGAMRDAAPHGMTSVQEVIDGKERQVFVISDDDDDDAPPAEPLRNPPAVLPAARTSGKRKASLASQDDELSAQKRQRHEANVALLDQLAASLSTHGMHGAPNVPADAYTYNAVPGYGIAPHYSPLYGAQTTLAGASPATSVAAAPAPMPAPGALDNAMLLARNSHSQYLPPYAPSTRPRPYYEKQAEAWQPAVEPPATEAVDDKDGHFIVREGDQITPRYLIRGLLGQGTFGKVVSCYDRKLRRHVAIKVIRAVQKYRDASQIEIRVLRCLRQNDPTNEFKCVQFLETFDFRNHVCIVSDLLDRSVFDFLKDNHFQPFPCRNIWGFAKQLFKSVAFLHSLTLIHTDLKPENVLLVDASFDMVATSRSANARKKRVLRNDDIRLIDFGSATFNDEYHSGVVSTRHYRAPEIILGMGWSYPCDAWSLGCILVEFFTGDALFQTHDNLEHLAMMERVLGALPDDYRRKAETYKPEYFRNGQLDYPKPDTSKQSRRYVQNMKALQEIVMPHASYAKHNQRFVSLLRRLLDFDPSKRITMQEALRHPYFDLLPHEIPP